MFGSPVMMTEYTLLTYMPIVFYKLVFGMDYSYMKIPHYFS
jgi:hypothetical protein